MKMTMVNIGLKGLNIANFYPLASLRNKVISLRSIVGNNYSRTQRVQTASGQRIRLRPNAVVMSNQHFKQTSHTHQSISQIYSLILLLKNAYLKKNGTAVPELRGPASVCLSAIDWM